MTTANVTRQTGANPSAGDPVRVADIRSRLEGANINARTFLATDYLNHFNEVVMLLEMLPDMPECLEDIESWQPRSYCDHFRLSSFSQRDLAIEAYALAPGRYRLPFDRTIASLNRLIGETIARARAGIGTDGPERLRSEIGSVMIGIRVLQERAGNIINGAVFTLDQSAVDALFDGGPHAETPVDERRARGALPEDPGSPD